MQMVWKDMRHDGLSQWAEGGRPLSTLGAIFGYTIAMIGGTGEVMLISLKSRIWNQTWKENNLEKWDSGGTDCGMDLPYGPPLSARSASKLSPCFILDPLINSRLLIREWIRWNDCQTKFVLQLELRLLDQCTAPYSSRTDHRAYASQLLSPRLIKYGQCWLVSFWTWRFCNDYE